MSKTGEIPYTWKQIEDQVREAILCQANILESFGPWRDQNLVADYLCIDREAFKGRSVEDIKADELDISQHQLLHYVSVAYKYAYQLDGFDPDPNSEWHDVDGLLQGFPQTDAEGERSPFCTLNDFPLRRMLETFYARFRLFSDEWGGWGVSIRELALLSNMTVPAVRTSLSKEGFKLEKVQVASAGNREEGVFRLDDDDAILWLSRRRGFIPQVSQDQAARIAQITGQLLTDKAASFPDLLSRLMELRDISVEQLSQTAEVDQEWLTSLLAAEAARPDVDALRRVAQAIDLLQPEFAAAAVHHLVAMTSAGV